MTAIPNKVVIGDESAPILTFHNDSILSLVEETATSIVGEELFIDQFVPEVRYGLIIRQVIRPADRETYEQFLTSEGLLLCGKYTYDIRAIPYGTPVRFYTNDRISGLFYCDSVERLSKESFKINCISAIGLMDQQRHVGGIYSGARFDAVAREIMGDDYDYQIDPEVAELQVYGWLPYSTRRRNLHQLILAYGVNITKSDTGGMLFAFLKVTDPENIPNSRVFSGGQVSYGEPASRVEIIEHGYHFLSSVGYEVLYDTKGDVCDNTIISFDRPYNTGSLMVAEGSNLIINECGTNYAIISGSGVLMGQPYVHTTKRITADNEEALLEKVVTVEDATLVTAANSENVLARLSAYYFNVTTVKTGIVVDGERVSRRYILENAFNEHTHAFLARMSTSVTSFARAECEFIADYLPVAQGSSFQNCEILELSDEGQTWKIPDNVFEKENQKLRVVLIGEGYDGENGSNGEDGQFGDDNRGGYGGAGGKGGSGGKGGKILSATIDCSSLEFLTYGKDGKDTWLTAEDAYYSSAKGNSSNSGFVEMFSGAVYGLPGNPGVDGAAGGEGGAYPAIGGSGNAATDGSDLEYNGIIYKGGKKSQKQAVRAQNYGGFHENMTWRFGGSGGGGAAVGRDGNDAGILEGGSGSVEHYPYGGDGADASMAQSTVAMYGSGGNGGSGGGGGGGASNMYWWNDVYSTLIAVWSQESTNIPGKGGKGSAGTAGYRGCIIIYY